MVKRLLRFLESRHGQIAALLAVISVSAGLLAILGLPEWAFAVFTVVFALTAVVAVDTHRKVGDQYRRLSSGLGRTRTDLQKTRKDLAGVRADWRQTNDAIGDATTRLEVAQRDSHADLRVLREQALVRLDLVDRTLDGVGETLDAVDSALADVKVGGDRAVTRMVELFDASRGHLDETASRLEERARVTAAELVSELDAARQVHLRIPLPGREPLLAGWALAPRALLDVLRTIEEHRPKLVLECGSGTSTIFIAALLDQLGDGGTVISLDHLPEYAEATREALLSNRLTHVAEVRLAPLSDVAIDGKTWTWYEKEAVADLTAIDMVLVDGPPKASGRHARFPALPVLADRLSPGAIILLDDSQREEEQWTLRRWKASHPLQRKLGLTRDMAILHLHDTSEQEGS